MDTTPMVATPAASSNGGIHMALQTIADIAIPPGAATGGSLAGAIIGTYAASVWGYLPGVVAVIGGCLAIVWYALMIYESKTFEAWRADRASRIKARRIAKLNAKEKVIRAELEALELKRGAAATAAAVVQAAERTAADKVATATAEAKIEVARSETEIVQKSGGGNANA